MSILLSDTSFAESQVHWTNSGNYLYKLTDRTLWQPRHPLHRIMLNCSTDNLISLYIHTVCTVCHIIYTACCDATSSILHVVHCKELQAVHCTLLACGGHIKFAIWTTAVPSLTLNCFCIFFLLTVLLTIALTVPGLLLYPACITWHLSALKSICHSLDHLTRLHRAYRYCKALTSSSEYRVNFSITCKFQNFTHHTVIDVIYVDYKLKRA